LPDRVSSRSISSNIPSRLSLRFDSFPTMPEVLASFCLRISLR